jgi:hypothetical protein
MVLAASCEDSIFCSKGTHSTTKRSRVLSNIFWNGKKTFLYFHLIICWQLWFLGIKPTSNIPSLLYGILCWMVHSRLLDLSLWSWIHPLFLKNSTESSIPGLNCDQGIDLGYSFFSIKRLVDTFPVELCHTRNPTTTKMKAYIHCFSNLTHSFSFY